MTVQNQRPEREANRENAQGGRTARIPVGSTKRYKLALSKPVPEGKVARIVADEGDRIAQHLAAGYEFVEDPGQKIGSGHTDSRDQLSTKIRKPIGTSKDKRAKIGYLMYQNKEDYEADQKAKVDAEVERLKEIKRGKMETGTVPQDGFYQKPGSVKISGVPD